MMANTQGCICSKSKILQDRTNGIKFVLVKNKAILRKLFHVHVQVYQTMLIR